MTNEKCAVPGCTSQAVVEVRLYDVYLSCDEVEIFDQRDFTCPFLCAQHVQENEQSSRGERKPRAIVRYPYSNQQGAQGFTIYRSLSVPSRYV